MSGCEGLGGPDSEVTGKAGHEGLGLLGGLAGLTSRQEWKGRDK